MLILPLFKSTKTDTKTKFYNSLVDIPPSSHHHHPLGPSSGLNVKLESQTSILTNASSSSKLAQAGGSTPSTTSNVAALNNLAATLLQQQPQARLGATYSRTPSMTAQSASQPPFFFESTPPSTNPATTQSPSPSQSWQPYWPPPPGQPSADQIVAAAAANASNPSFMHLLTGGGGPTSHASLAKAMSMPSLPVLAAAGYPSVLNKQPAAPPSPPTHQKLLCQQFLNAAPEFYNSIARVNISNLIGLF